MDSYDWPPNYYPDLDKHFIVYGGNLQNNGFQARYDETFLSLVNTCAWGLSWLDSRAQGDNESSEDALSKIEQNISGTILGEEQTSRAYLTDMVDLARLGDPSKIQTWVSANCDSLFWIAKSQAVFAPGLPDCLSRMYDELGMIGRWWPCS